MGGGGEGDTHYTMGNVRGRLVTAPPSMNAQGVHVQIDSCEQLPVKGKG